MFNKSLNQNAEDESLNSKIDTANEDSDIMGLVCDDGMVIDSSGNRLSAEKY